MTHNHSIQILFPTHNVGITLLTSRNKGLKEYRFTFSDGVIRYATADEIKVSEHFGFIYNHILKLEPICESKLGLQKGHLMVKTKPNS